MASTSTAQRNIEMARKAYTAFNEGNLDEALATADDDILWHAGGDNPLSGEYQGKDAVKELLVRFGQLTDGTYEADVHDILGSDEHVVVIGTATSTRHGRTHTSRFVDVIHPAEDGRVKEFWRFVEDQAADDEFYNE